MNARAQQPRTAAPRRKRRWLRNVLIAATLLFAACAAGSIFAGPQVYDSVRATIEARSATEAFINALKKDPGRGYESLCQETRQRFTQAQYESYVTSQPAIGEFDISSASVTGSTAAVTAELNHDNGTHGPHVFALSKQDGEWKVCGDPY